MHYRTSHHTCISHTSISHLLIHVQRRSSTILTDNGQNPEQWLCYTCYPNLPRVCVCAFFPQNRHPWPSYPMLTRKFAVRTGRMCANQDYTMIGGSPVPGQWMRSWREVHTFQADFLMFRPSNSLRMQVDDSKWHVCLHTVWTLFVQQRPRKPVCGQDARLVLAEFWVPLRVAAGAPEGAKTWGQLCVSCIGAQMRLQNVDLVWH